MRIPNFLSTDEIVYHRVISFLSKRKKSTLEVIHTKFDMDNKDRYAKAMLYLFGEEYIKDDNNEVYELTKKGMNAYNSDYFLKKNRKVWVNRFTNLLLIICNVAIAAATVIAISIANKQIRTGNEIDNIKERIYKLEQKK